MSVPIQESKWSYMCVKGVDIDTASTIFLFDFGMFWQCGICLLDFGMFWQCGICLLDFGMFWQCSIFLLEFRMFWQCGIVCFSIRFWMFWQCGILCFSFYSRYSFQFIQKFVIYLKSKSVFLLRFAKLHIFHFILNLNFGV